MRAGKDATSRVESSDTHLHGPHQSVCWLRPKRALHFLGEAGSEHRSMRGEEWQGRDTERRRSRRKKRCNINLATSDITTRLKSNFQQQKYSGITTPGKESVLGKYQSDLLSRGEKKDVQELASY